MPSHCCSAHRCSSISCATCAWRYSLRVSRRTLAYEPRQLHAVTIDCAADDHAEFRRWRRALHNLINYRRRQSRWWQSVGAWGWSDGNRLHGVVELGAITTTEFMVALRRLGEVRLRPIEVEHVRAEVYAAAMSISAGPGIGAAGRYQSFKIAIGPLAVTGRATPIIGDMFVEPMAVTF